MSNSIFVFVYGTLRRHESNHLLLAETHLISYQAKTRGKLFDTGFGFPAMTEDEGNVYGELYEINQEQLHQLDRLEGYRADRKTNHYDRVTKHIVTDRGEFEAFVYVYSKEKASDMKFIESGDWKVYRHQQDAQYIYFAYGSMMDDGRLKKKHINHKFQHVLGRGIVHNYEVKFTTSRDDGGRADLVEGESLTEGKAFQIDSEALDYLYNREGVAGNFYRPTFIDLEVDGKLLKDVWTFVVVNKESTEFQPPESYAREIVRGGKSILSDAYLEQLARKMGLTV